MAAITVGKLKINTFTNEEWGGCNFRTFNTVLSK